MHFLKKFPKEDWRPGDCVITNDPWMATGHLPDVTMVAPIFHRVHAGRILRDHRTSARHPSGALWSADCRELFEEGLRIPPIRMLVEDRPVEDVMESSSSAM